MTRAAIIAGVGISHFGPFREIPETTLARQAILAALDDAAVGIADVEAFYCATAASGMLAGQRVLRDFHTKGAPIFNVENACASSATALHLAVSAIRAGQIRTALVFGLEGLSRRRDDVPVDKSDWNLQRGMIMPALYAMRARRYMEDFRVSIEVLADIAVKNRQHGIRNPVATTCKVVTREEVLASRPIAEPLTLLQCCSGSLDGAAAVVVTDRALGGRKPVFVRASILQSGRVEFGHVDMTEADITRRTAKKGYEEAGVGPKDVNVIELHDAFTIAELLYYEALGLCQRGRAGELLEQGETTIGGRIPVNPSGGLLAKGHPVGATGVAQVVEIYDQLQGRAGGRQVEGARLGLTHVTGSAIFYFQNSRAQIGRHSRG